MKGLRRFWFTFVEPPMFSPLAFGCGVTGYDQSDALEILRGHVLASQPTLVVNTITEDVDVGALDAGHVIPNMGLVTVRGVWFPLGYDQKA